MSAMHHSVVKKLKRAGLTCAHGRGGHIAILDARTGARVGTAGSTPSDGRAWKNLRADLRRQGYDVA